MKIVAMIPARYAASRFPGKLMKMLGDKTVIRHTHDNTLATGLFDEVWVVTDSDIIYEEIVTNGGKAVMSKQQHESGSDRIAEAAAEMEVDIVVNVQGDTPFVDKVAMRQLVDLFDDNEVQVGSMMLSITDKELLHNPNVVKVVLDARGLAHYFSRAPIPFARDHAGTAWWDGRAQAASPTVAALSGFAPLRHIGIYSYRAGFLREFPLLVPAPTEAVEALEQLRALWHGHRIAVHLAEASPGPGVDTPEDLERVRRLFR